MTLNLVDEFKTFQETRIAVKKDLKWRSAGIIRDATALALLPYIKSGNNDLLALKNAAAELKSNNSKLHFLKSSVRYTIAATLLSTGQDPLAFAQRISAARKDWKQTGLRRTSPYEGASLILLALTAEDALDVPNIRAVKVAFDTLKKQYFWHVGPYTLPALSIASTLNDNALLQASTLFQRLKKEKFPSTYRMSASLIASIRPQSATIQSGWMSELHVGLKKQKLHSAARLTQTIAMASLCDKPVRQIIDDVKEYKAKLQESPFKGSSAAVLAFNFVTTTYAQSIYDLEDHDGLKTLPALVAAIQAYIAIQQQAAATAAIAGSTAAVAAAS